MKIPDNWQEKTLNDICDISSSKRVYRREYVNDGVPFYRGKEIILKANNENISQTLFISRDQYYEIKHKFGVPLPGDILLTSVGTLGIPYVVKDNEVFYFKDGNLTWFRNYRDVDNIFLYYWLISSQMKEQVFSSHIGVAQPALTIVGLKSFQIYLPPLPTQRKIATILSAYDDLIENNTRRFQILEEMAQAIYREWFVQFRFPGHEGVRMVDSGTELGEVPEGWEVRKLGDVCTIVMGQSPKSEFYNQSGIGLPFHQGVKDFGSRFPTDRVYCTVQKRLAESGDILFSVRAPVGRMNLSDKKMVIGRGLCAICSKDGCQPYIFELLKAKFVEEDIMGGGTIFKSVTKDDMYGLDVLYPSPEIISQFVKISMPVYSELEILTKKNINLCQTRDLLLPRLVSGEVDVSEVEVVGTAAHE